jgi:uncharacterized membrane protein
LLRGWAVLVMIETHVVNATLMKELMDGGAFTWIKFINGLVAPSFLFASGLAFAITTRRKLSDYLSFGPPLYIQIRRLLFVVMIGYLLHIPKFNFRQLLYEASELSWQIFFQADVLQCIGVSLLSMQALLLIVKKERRLYQAVFACSLAIVFASPVVWGIDAREYLPLPLAGYMNGMYFQNFPGFPIFPWTAFVFAGAVVGYFYLKAKDASGQRESGSNETVMMKRLVGIAAAMIVVAIVLEPFAASLYPTYNYGLSSPSFFFLRLGIVLLLCAGMFFYEKRFSVSSRSLITLVGRESLIVYTLHLFLLYGDFATFNFTKNVNHTFGYVEAGITTVILVGLMILLARAWDAVRKKDPKVKRRIQWGVALGMAIVFFFGPGE